ncbi:hypothetical protein Esti_001264 [Eimeria stiedai]
MHVTAAAGESSNSGSNSSGSNSSGSSSNSSSSSTMLSWLSPAIRRPESLRNPPEIVYPASAEQQHQQPQPQQQQQQEQQQQHQEQQQQQQKSFIEDPLDPQLVARRTAARVPFFEVKEAAELERKEQKIIKEQIGKEIRDMCRESLDDYVEFFGKEDRRDKGRKRSQGPEHPQEARETDLQQVYFRRRGKVKSSSSSSSSNSSSSSSNSSSWAATFLLFQGAPTSANRRQRNCATLVHRQQTKAAPAAAAAPAATAAPALTAAAAYEALADGHSPSVHFLPEEEVVLPHCSSNSSTSSSSSRSYSKQLQQQQQQIVNTCSNSSSSRSYKVQQPAATPAAVKRRTCTSTSSIRPALFFGAAP